MKTKKVGRPTKMTDAVIAKLEEAYALGCSDREACLYADIAPSVLYRYQSAHPEFRERKAVLKEKPVLKARIASDKLLTEGDPVHTRWFLEHRKADEFNTRAEIALQADGALSIEDRGKALDSFLERFIDD